MSASNSGPDLLNDLAHEFAQRYRRGERPPLTEYTDRHPELAEQIRELFPALVVIEEFGSVAGEPAQPNGRYLREGREVPRQLGEYRILREIGRGGMGIVYEAVQESLGRHVALKVLPFHSLISPTHRERFEREARAAARLHHTNIVPVFGIGEHEGMHYYAMQFIQGQGLDTVLKEVLNLRKGHSPAHAQALTISIARSLRTNQFDATEHEAVAGGPASEPSAAGPKKGTATRSAALVASLETSHNSDLTGSSEALYFRGVGRLGVQVAEALAYTHQQGIAHRDIKPSNLLLDTQGVVWITDFGLVKDEASDNLTGPGDLLGTLRYMAPERLQDGGDSRSDLYGLGATLYEMLTLQPAFADAPRARLMDRILREEPIRPRKLDPKIPRDLETIVLKALAKEPALRYQSAAELAEDLRRFLADRPIKARRSSPVEKTWRWCRRNPAIASLTALTALLLVVIAAVKSASVMRLQEQLERTERAEADKTEKLWDSYLAHAQASRWSGRVGRRFEGLAAVAKAAAIRPDLRLRNEAIALFTLPDMRPFKQLPEGIPAANTALALDPGFERYACGDPQGNLSVRWLADNREIAAFPGSGKHAFFLRFSPDSRFLAATYHLENAVRIWDISRGRIVLDIPMCGIVDFKPKGCPAALVVRGDCVSFYDLPSGKETQRLPIGSSIAFGSLHPDGRLLAVSTQQHPQSRIFDLETGKVIRTHPQSGCVFWNADGTMLAVIASDSLYVWNTRTWTQQAILKTPDLHTSDVAFNQQGDLLASVGWDNVLRVWDPMNGRLLLSKEGGRGAQFSRDGRLLAGTFDGSNYQIWEVTRSLECRVLSSPPSKDQVASDACFSADGRLLVSACGDGARLWDLAAGRAFALLDTAGICGATLFLSDGSLITSSPAGLLRWPVRANQVDARAGGASAQTLVGGLSFGPPQRLLTLEPTGFYGARLCPDGKVATLERAKGQLIVIDPHSPSDRHVLPGHRNVYSGLAASPDGRWLAASTRWDLPQDKLRISDLRTGQIAWTLNERVTGAFSPDGKWLATAGGTCRLWEVGSWRLAKTIAQEPGLGDTTAAAFTPDAKVLAIAHAAQVVRLVDPNSGQELATLAAPSSVGPVARLCFSPDGSQLAGVMERFGVQLWDLRLIRQQLADLGLDWDLPPYEPAESAPSTETLTVTVETSQTPGPTGPPYKSR